MIKTLYPIIAGLALSGCLAKNEPKPVTQSTHIQEPVALSCAKILDGSLTPEIIASEVLVVNISRVKSMIEDIEQYVDSPVADTELKKQYHVLLENLWDYESGDTDRKDRELLRDLFILLNDFTSLEDFLKCSKKIV